MKPTNIRVGKEPVTWKDWLTVAIVVSFFIVSWLLIESSFI